MEGMEGLFSYMPRLPHSTAHLHFSSDMSRAGWANAIARPTCQPMITCGAIMSYLADKRERQGCCFVALLVPAISGFLSMSLVSTCPCVYNVLHLSACDPHDHVATSLPLPGMPEFPAPSGNSPQSHAARVGLLFPPSPHREETKSSKKEPHMAPAGREKRSNAQTRGRPPFLYFLHSPPLISRIPDPHPFIPQKNSFRIPEGPTTKLLLMVL